MEEKIKARIKQLQELQQQRQKELNSLRNIIGKLEIDIIEGNGEIRGLQSILKEEKPGNAEPVKG